jgi:hypothetical protein
MGRARIGRKMDIWDGRILWEGKSRAKGRGLWHVTKTSEATWTYRAFGNLALGRIREFACDRRETLFLAFLERFQYWNSCTANFLGHVTSRHMRDSTSRLDPFRLSRFRDRISTPRYCDPYF